MSRLQLSIMRSHVDFYLTISGRGIPRSRIYGESRVVWTMWSVVDLFFFPLLRRLMIVIDGLKQRRKDRQQTIG